MIDLLECFEQVFPVSFVRAILLGDVAKRLDMGDAEDNIGEMQETAESALDAKEREIDMLKAELGRHKLATRTLTRFLIEKGVIQLSEIEDFIGQVDVEEGVIDRKTGIDAANHRFHIPAKAIPKGAFKKISKSKLPVVQDTSWV